MPVEVRKFPAPGIRSSEAMGRESTPIQTQSPASPQSKAHSPRPKGALTKGQLSAIWTIIRKNGLDEDAFREFLVKEFKVSSTKKLSQADAAEVIHSLKVLIGEEYEPHIRGMTWGITRPQMRYLKKLAADLGWDDPKRLDGMVRKMFPPKNRLELLNKREATALIIAMEKMNSPHVPSLASNRGEAERIANSK